MFESYKVINFDTSLKELRIIVAKWQRFKVAKVQSGKVALGIVANYPDFLALGK